MTQTTDECFDPGLEELARNLAAAFIAYRLGVSFATAHKNLKAQPVGMFWFNIAVIVNQTVIEDSGK